MLHLMNKIILKPGKRPFGISLSSLDILRGNRQKQRGNYRKETWSESIVRTINIWRQGITRSVLSQSEFSLLKMKKSVILFWLQRITAAYHMRRAIGLTDRAEQRYFPVDPWRRRQSSRISRRLLCRCCCRSIPLRRYVPGTGKYHPGPTRNF